jgi:hypothetical protein
MQPEKENFVKAVKNDEYSEYELSENLILLTDWESDHKFNPVVIDAKRQYSEDEVDTILMESMSELFAYEVLHFEEDTYNDLYYPEGLRFTLDELEESPAWC